MRFFLSGRNARRLLVLGIVVTALVAGMRTADLLRLRKEVFASQEELEKERLIAALEAPLAKATGLAYDDVGMAGEPLPAVVVERLKENYRLPNEANPPKDAEKAKKTLTTATVSQLRSTLGVDERTARFIAANADVSSWEELAQQRRQLFEENEDAIEPLIVARISRFAAESGIEKIDQFKVEPPKTNVRRVRSPAARTAPAAHRPPTTPKPLAADLDAKRDAVRKELRGENEDALLKALDDLVNAASGDEALERAARAALEELLNKEHPSPGRAAPIRLAAIRLQPHGHFVVTHLVEAYATRALKRFSDEGEEPVHYVEEPFPPLASLPRPVQRRLLEALAKNGGAWFTKAQLQEILGAGKEKTAPSKPTAPEPSPLREAEEAKLRAFHAQLVDVMWRVAQMTQVAKNAEPETYAATLLFKCSLEQLVNFLFKIENDVRWLRVVGLRIAVEQPDQPVLGVTLNVEASILKPSSQAEPKG